MAEPNNLKRAVSVERAKTQARIRDRQGGVPTYFDAFLCTFLDQLEFLRISAPLDNAC